MKRYASFGTLILSAAFLLLLGGCSSRYVVVTSDYAVYIAASEPDIDTKADTVTFKDEGGNKIVIPRQNMKQMRELKD